jgi:hypothetical protein
VPHTSSSASNSKRDPDTGRFLPSRNDGDERWERLLAETAADHDAAEFLIESVRADRAAGRTLAIGWDDVPTTDEGRVSIRP